MLDIAAMLSRFGMPAADAAAFASSLRTGPRIALGPGLEVRLSPVEHEADLGRRLREAAERVVPRRRGRPPARVKRP